MRMSTGDSANPIEDKCPVEHITVKVELTEEKTIGTDMPCGENIGYHFLNCKEDRTTNFFEEYADRRVIYNSYQTENRNNPRTKEVKALPCALCGKVFPTKGQLTQHLVCHSDQKDFVCDICYMAFRRKHDMLQHRNRHVNRKNIFCAICKTMFTNKSSLNKHLTTQHGGKSFPCEICLRSFSRKDNLKQHMLCHSEREIFVCGTCNKEFINKQHCKKHEREHNRAGLEVHKPKKFECDYCKNTFVRKDNLTRHIVGHLKKLFKEQLKKHKTVY